MNTVSFLQLPSDSPALAERFLQAARTCWDIEDRSVIFLNSGGSRERTLRRQFQALGLDVFDGADCSDMGQQPVIVIEAAAWQQTSIRKSSEAIRRRLPEAAICIVTSAPSGQWPSFALHRPVFDDARALLQEAGFGFFSISGADHELHA